MQIWIDLDLKFQNNTPIRPPKMNESHHETENGELENVFPNFQGCILRFQPFHLPGCKHQVILNHKWLDLMGHLMKSSTSITPQRFMM